MPNFPIVKINVHLDGVEGPDDYSAQDHW